MCVCFYMANSWRLSKPRSVAMNRSSLLVNRRQLGDEGLCQIGSLSTCMSVGTCVVKFGFHVHVVSVANPWRCFCVVVPWCCVSIAYHTHHKSQRQTSHTQTCRDTCVSYPTPAHTHVHTHTHTHTHSLAACFPSQTVGRLVVLIPSVQLFI